MKTLKDIFTAAVIVAAPPIVGYEIYQGTAGFAHYAMAALWTVAAGKAAYDYFIGGKENPPPTPKP